MSASTSVHPAWLALGTFFLSALGLCAEDPSPDSAQEAPPQMLPAHRLTLRNSDELGGRFLAFDPGGSLRWETDKADAPLIFPASSPLKIDLKAEEPGLHRPASAIVQLRNGDEMPGTVRSLDGESLLLDTEFSGDLTLARRHLRQVEFFEPDSLRYFGPDGVDDWVQTTTPAAWTFREGALVARQAGSIGREIPLPDRARILLDLTWEQNLYMSLSVFAEDPDEGNPGPGSYTLLCQYATFQLMRGVPVRDRRPLRPPALNRRQNLQLREQLERFQLRAGGQAAKTIGMQVEKGEFYQKRKARLELFLHRERREISLAVDGEVLSTWSDPEGFHGKGNGVVLRHFGHTPRTAVHRIEVTDWNGILPGGDPVAASSENADLVFLRNSDVLAGEVLSVTEDRLLCRTDFAELPVPLKRVQRIVFRDSAEVSSTGPRFDTRAFFRLGGSVTVRMVRADEQYAVVESPYFTERRFLLDRLSAVHFDVHNESLWQQDDSGFWFPELPRVIFTLPDPVVIPSLLQIPDIGEFDETIWFEEGGGLILVE
ncbi:MAG TPA: hypothetical protein VMN36_06100 [Verrucomicrobiales bacterium]|nr:hypothetical protein [Verrucomicrobiales bacterium]